MSKTYWARRNKQMGEVALPAKFSAKKYTRRGWCRPTILLQPTAVYHPPAVFTPLCTSAPHTQPTYFSACPHLKEVQPGLFLCLSKFTKLCNCTHNLTLYSSVSATAAKACSSELEGSEHIDKMYSPHTRLSYEPHWPNHMAQNRIKRAFPKQLLKDKD